MARLLYPGSLRRRGPESWQWRADIEGRSYAKTFKCSTKKDASLRAEAEAKRIRRRHERERLQLPDSLLFSQLIEKFEREVMPGLRADGTRRSYNDSLKPIKLFFAQKPDLWAHELRSGHIKEFITWRRGHRLRKGKAVAGRVSERTVQKDYTVLHRIYSYAIEVELVDANPAASVARPEAEVRDPPILSEPQFEDLLAECRRSRQKMLPLYALTLDEAGGRSESEILWLRWRDVHLEDGFLWIASREKGRRTKSGKGRWVPMTDRLKQAMREHFAAYRFATYGGKPTDWVFHHTQTRRHHKAGERIKSMRESLMNAAQRAGVPDDFRPHDLRHRRVTTWLSEGKDVTLVMEAMGHSDLRTTMGYTHLAKEHLRRLVTDAPGTRDSELLMRILGILEREHARSG